MTTFRIEYSYIDYPHGVFVAAQYNWQLVKADSKRDARKDFRASFVNAKKRQLKILSVTKV